MKLTNTSESQLHKIKCLLYGASGTGKTYSIRELPEKETLIISAESGTLSLLGTSYDVSEVHSWEEVEENLQSLQVSENALKKYKYIFVDSLTEINELCKDHIIKVARPQLKGKDIGKIYDDIMARDDWGVLLNKMSRLIRGFRDLPFNVIFTCLEDWKTDDKTGETIILPSLNGQLQKSINQYFDFVFRLIVKDSEDSVERYFLTVNDGRSMAKVRGTWDKVIPASWQYVINKIEEIKKEYNKGGSK